MRALAAVFAREIFARRLVFPVALAAGFTPLFVTLVTGWSKRGAADMRLIVAFVTAAAFTLAFALLFGGSVLAAETSEKRISFFFSRPIPAGAIWGGKLLAALFLTFVPALLALAPAALTSGFEFRAPDLRIAALLLAVCALFLVLGAHAAVTLARLRSPWIALDALFAILSALGVTLSARSLLRNGVLQRFQVLSSGPIWALLAFVAVCLLSATFVQVAAGRTDARRAHGAFSATLWGLLGAGVLALSGYAGWVASAGAVDLASIGGVLTAPRGGPWVAVSGPLRAGRGAGLFLFDTATNRSLRIRSEDAVFSANGERAAWAEERLGFFEGERKSDLFVADLVSGKAVETDIPASVWCRVALSPSGRRLATLDGESTLSVYDMGDPAHPKQLAAFQIEKTSRIHVFVGEDTIRLFPWAFDARKKQLPPREFEIEELSVLSKKSFVTGHVERDGPAGQRARISADGRFLVETQEKRLTLHDGRTGALISVLSEDLAAPKARFLSGDRIVVAGVAGENGILKIFLESEKNKSAPSLLVDLGPAASLVLGGEVAPGRVAVALNSFRSNDERARGAWKLAFVDVATGAVSSGPEGLVPADRFSWWLSPALPPAEAGSPSSTLFCDADGRLVRLDPVTGAQTVLLGRSK